MASLRATEGVEEAIFLGVTKEEPNEVTLSSWLKATLATALAKGMPF
jgi:hypothetical protein